jgi:septation ring formation regulator EzrA
MSTPVQLSLDTVGIVVAVLATVIGWVVMARRAAVSEGRNLEKVRNLKGELEAMKGELKGIQECTQLNQVSNSGLKTDLEWLKAAVLEIKDTLTRILSK